jgi:hypothetical protein
VYAESQRKQCACRQEKRAKHRNVIEGFCGGEGMPSPVVLKGSSVRREEVRCSTARQYGAAEGNRCRTRACYRTQDFRGVLVSRKLLRLSKWILTSFRSKYASLTCSVLHHFTVRHSPHGRKMMQGSGINPAPRSGGATPAEFYEGDTPSNFPVGECAQLALRARSKRACSGKHRFLVQPFG